MHKNFYVLFSNLALIGNILFILWMTYNSIDESFKGTIYQIISYIGLTILLLLNSFLIYKNKKDKS